MAKGIKGATAGVVSGKKGAYMAIVLGAAIPPAVLGLYMYMQTKAAAKKFVAAQPQAG